MSDRLIGVALCGTAGLLLLGWAAGDARVVRRLRREGIRTRGVVVDNVRVHDGDGPAWTPVVAFTDQRGHRVEFSPRMRGSGLGLATGREVPVLYLGHHPQTARVHMWRHLVGPVVFLLFCAAIFLGAGALIAATA
ncbi:DUF3592 domain-containing protein [Streptomyces sp. NPDC093261]|uniref:DUF3592 domain-containing protein n=1 Tax=Streptomyces sp. NPDC093261 TaxID=3366037 RepID=UPI0038005EBB